MTFSFADYDGDQHSAALGALIGLNVKNHKE